MWVVIPEASDSLDPFLKEIGVAWVVRKLAASVQVTTTLLHTPDKFSVHDKSSAGETLVELTPDGEYREVTNSENKTSRMKCTQGDGEFQEPPRGICPSQLQLPCIAVQWEFLYCLACADEQVR